MLSAQALIQKFPDLLEIWQGSPTAKILSGVTSTEDAASGLLVFASKQSQLNEAVLKKATVIVSTHKLELPQKLDPETVILRTAHVGLAMSKILPYFQNPRFTANGQQHPLSFVHPTAQLGKNVTIGAFVSVAEHVVIGDDTYIGANSVIEAHAKLGKKCHLHPQVFVGAECELGNDCEIHPHVTIGSDGFGYAQDVSFNHHKLPQLGKVVIGDRVEIGAGTAIDRAAFTETKIGSGTKIDNLCHIAHNCSIGENSVIAGGFMMAGSSHVGAKFMVGGTAVIADHVTVGDGVMLAGRSTVTNDIEKPGAYGGYPVQPMKDHLKTVASLPHLVRLRKQVNRILKHLNLQEEDTP